METMTTALLRLEDGGRIGFVDAEKPVTIRCVRMKVFLITTKITHSFSLSRPQRRILLNNPLPRYHSFRMFSSAGHFHFTLHRISLLLSIRSGSNGIVTTLLTVLQGPYNNNGNGKY